jgi:hypothetical protein
MPLDGRHLGFGGIPSGYHLFRGDGEFAERGRQLLEARPQQRPGVRGPRGAPELDAELRIEQEANWTNFRVTHSVVPFVPANNS